MAFRAKLTSRSDPKHTTNPTQCLHSEGDGVKHAAVYQQLPDSSEQEWNPECFPPLATHTPPRWIMCFLGFVAAAGPSLAPLPFKVKQTQLHSHREKKLVFSHLRSFFLFHPVHPWERSFPFGHPNSGQAHAAQCCIHTPPFSLPRSPTCPFSRGSPVIHTHSQRRRSKSCDLLAESMRQPYYPCWIIPCGGASVSG